MPLFFASKIGWLFVQPLSLAFLLLLASIIAGFMGLRRLQLTGAALSALLLFVALFTTTGGLLLQQLEDRIPPAVVSTPPACLLVHGGGFEGAVTKVRGGVELNQAGERYLEMLRLARLYPDARIIVSGGDGSLMGGEEDDFTIVRRLAAGFGLPESRFIPEALSRNTYENAVNSRLIMEREGFADCLMITSAFHMPRALGMMRKVGARVSPWPVDYRTDGRTGFRIDLTEPMSNAQKMATAVREWLGLAANYVSGRTESLFPAP